MQGIPEDFEYPISKFGLPQGGLSVARSELLAFEGLVPDSYLEFLATAGTGIWQDGYFQIVDPRRYSSLIDQVFNGDPDFRSPELVVIGFGGFGTLLLWSERYWNIEVDPLFHCVSSTYYFKPKANITSSLSLSNSLAGVGAGGDTFDDDGKPLFKRALKAYGRLQPDQIYAPRLHPALGGPRTLENFRPASALEALSIAAQAAPFILKDVLGQPPKPSRVIGG